ncbi:polyprotein [marsupivirus A1]|uniref:Genome polyprotein n=1 Tax=marsupivirus A1 TaxID=2614061 RepID=A0A5J6D4G7_9PICO|nr:polyprotein [marsupivirus A1]QEQ92497.1 polyprotein [marsupivirus A1]
MGTPQSKQETGRNENSGNHGTINYNYYNQQYQGSIDVSGLMSSGSSGASSGDPRHPAANGQDWLSLLTSGFKGAAAVAPLLADQSTEQRLGLADRISSDVFGSTAIVTQAGVGDLVVKHKKFDVTSCVDRPNYGGPSVTRAIPIQVPPWSNQGSGSYLRIPLFGELLKLPTVFSDLLKRHYVVRTGFNVRVLTNASHYHAGCLGIYCVPECFEEQDKHQWGKDARKQLAWVQPHLGTTIYLPQMGLYPHQYLNLRTNTSASVTVPPTGPTPGSCPDIHDPWTLVIVVLAPLNYTAGASTTLDLGVTITPLDPVFHGIRPLLNKTQGPIPVSQRESSGAFMSTVPDTSVPVYGRVVNFRPVAPMRFTDYLQLATIPTFVQTAGRFDGSNFKPYLQIGANTSAGVLMGQFSLSLTSDALGYSFLGAFSRCFSQYRGSIKFQFCYTGNAATNGKIMVAYTPPSYIPPGKMEVAQQGIFEIWDIGLNSTFDFMVPYISTTNWRYCQARVPQFGNWPGYLSLFAYSNFTNPPAGAISTCLLISVCAGPDFSFRFPTDAVGTVTEGLTHNAEDGMANPSGPENQMETSGFPVEVSHTDVEFFWDRGFLLGSFTFPKAGRWQKLNEEWLWLTQAGRTLFKSMSACYFKADLEITWVPLTGEQIRVKWIPPGGVLPKYDSASKTFSALTNSPTIVSKKGMALTLLVPWTSPLDLYPIHYCGTKFFFYEPWSSVSGRTWGTVFCWSEAKDETSTMYIRFRQMQLYCPRPYTARYSIDRLQSFDPKNFQPHIDAKPTKLTIGNYDLLILAGDVEQNPGPILSKFLGISDEEINEYRATFQKAKEVLDSVDGAEVSRAVDSLRSFNSLVETVQSPTTISPWISVGKTILRYFIYAILVLKSGSPALTAALLAAAELTVHDTPQKLVTDLIRYYSGVFRTTPEPFDFHDSHFGSDDETQETQGVKGANDWFNLAKNLTWVVDLCQKIISWFKKWLKLEKESPIVVFENEVVNFPKYANILDSANGSSTKVTEAKNWMDKMYDDAVKLAQPFWTRLLHPYKCMRPFDSDARAEPVVIVLKGEPGQGKSVCAQILAEAVSKKLVGYKSVFSLNAGSKHFDGYAQQCVMIMDDVGQNPDGEDCSMFCQMVSTTNFLPPMASIPDKGKPFMTPVIILTTNQNMLTPCTVADPSALSRRMTYIFNVTASCEFKSCGRLDLAAALEPASNAKPDWAKNNSKLLHGAVCFSPGDIKIGNWTCSTGSTRYNANGYLTLAQVVSLVIDTVENKKNSALALSNIVQGPKACKDDDVFRYLELQHSPELVNWIRNHKNDKDVFEHLNQLFEKRARMQLWKDVLYAATMGVTIITMLLTMGYVLKEIFHTQAPYDPPKTKPKKAAKEPKQLITVEVEETQSPNIDLERSLFKRNIHEIEFFTKTEDHSFTSLIATVLSPGGNNFLVNTHIFDKLWHHFVYKGVTYERDDYMVKSFNSKGQKLDLYLVMLPRGNPSHDIIHHFVKSWKEESLPTVGSPVNGCVLRQGERFIFSGSFLGTSQYNHTNEGVFAAVGRYRANTYSGYCGAPMLGNVGGSIKIFGVHSSGTGVIGSSTLVTQDMLRTHISQGLKIDEPPGEKVYVPRMTSLRQTVAHKFYGSSLAPAVLSCRDSRLNDGIDFDEALFKKHTGNCTKFPKALRLATLMYADKLFGVIGRKNEPLTMVQAVNGVDGLDAMEKDTSPGLPFTLLHKRRQDIFDFEKVAWKDEKAKQMYLQYLNGDFEGHIFQTFLKDELRPLEKVKEGKTRIIDVAAFPHCLVGRMLLGRFCAHMHKNNGFYTGSAVGCDPDVDWTRFVLEAGHFSYVFDIDYSGFDSCHSTLLFEILAEDFFNEKNGFDPRVKQYLKSLAVSRHAYGEERYTLEGGLPSGCSATSILNTVINNIIIRTVLLMSYVNIDWEHVEFLAYGDDLLVATNYAFDFGHVASHAKTIGYKMTPAAKDGDFQAETTWDDVMFLKRKFEMDDDTVLVRPVMSTRLLKDLMAWSRPGTLQDKINSVALLAFHLDEGDYNDIFEPFKQAGWTIPDYDLLNALWYRKNGLT